MNSAVYRNLSVAALLLSTSAAQAQGWSGKVGVGAIATSGNSETSTINVNFALNYDRDIWHNQFKAKAIQARSEVKDDVSGQSQTKTTTEQYAVNMRSALDFSKYNYVFGQLDFEKDLFGGIRERTSQTIGLGRRLITTEAHKLDMELGVGARQIRNQGADARRQSQAVAKAGLKYDWKISDTSRFSQTLGIESGSDNTYLESVSELKLSVIGGIFTNIGYTVKHNTDVPVETERTDTITSISLSYEF